MVLMLLPLILLTLLFRRRKDLVSMIIPEGTRFFLRMTTPRSRVDRMEVATFRADRTLVASECWSTNTDGGQEGGFGYQLVIN